MVQKTKRNSKKTKKSSISGKKTGENSIRGKKTKKSSTRSARTKKSSARGKKTKKESIRCKKINERSTESKKTKKESIKGRKTSILVVINILVIVNIPVVVGIFVYLFASFCFSQANFHLDYLLLTLILSLQSPIPFLGILYFIFIILIYSNSFFDFSIVILVQTSRLCMEFSIPVKPSIRSIIF